MALLSTVWKITRFLSENSPPFCENTYICTEQLFGGFSEIKVKGQKTFFTEKIIEYQISIRIPFSLKKDEKLHIWISLFNFLSKTPDVINK
jgi:hypothetical protein